MRIRAHAHKVRIRDVCESQEGAHAHKVVLEEEKKWKTYANTRNAGE